MATAENTLPVPESPSSPATAQRWFQFRLRTLLLLPLLVVLLQKSADPTGFNLLIAGVGIGAIFGSLWAIGRMQIVGLKHSGLRRIAPVLWAAICGGATSGMFFGAAALWYALFCRGTWWMYSYTYTPGGTAVAQFNAWNTFVELTTNALGGGAAGAVVGVWGALIVGPAWAYLNYASEWFRHNEQSAQPRASSEVLSTEKLPTENRDHE